MCETAVLAKRSTRHPISSPRRSLSLSRVSELPTMRSIGQFDQSGYRMGGDSVAERTTPGYEPEPYVDAKEGAAFLCIHPKTLMRLAREGSVPAYSFSEGTRRHWRFLLSELDNWMRSRVNSSAHHPVRFVSQGRRQ